MLCTCSITLVSLCLLSGSLSNSNNAGRPTLCRNCGAIVGAGESNCSLCGAATAAALAARPHPAPDRETLRFARAVLNRPYKLTITILIANIFVYLLMWQSSGMQTSVLWDGFPREVLVAYGAKLNYLIAGSQHEWWRFITPMFIHVNLIHILVNMYSLWVIGPYVEKLYGSAKFVFFWVVTGIAGVVASYLTVRPTLAHGLWGRFVFKAFDEPSAGASGALFGLVGVLFVFGIRFRHELPEGFKRAFGTGLMPVILINLFIGFLGRSFIDNAAHLGGLLSGALVAVAVQYRRPEDSQRTSVIWRVLQVSALLLVAVSFFQISQHFQVQKQVVVPVELTHREVFLNYVNVMNQVQETIGVLVHEGDMSGVDAATMALQSVKAPDQQAEELRKRLIDLFVKAATSLSSSPTPLPGPRREVKLDEKLIDEFSTWNRDYDGWLKATAQQFDK